MEPSKAGMTRTSVIVGLPHILGGWWEYFPGSYWGGIYSYLKPALVRSDGRGDRLLEEHG